MHLIGKTSASNHLVELTPDEFTQLTRTLAAKPGESALVASMDLRELVQEVGPRLRKSHTTTTEKARNLVAAMFQFSGGIEPARLDQLLAELARQRIIREVAGKISYVDRVEFSSQSVSLSVCATATP